MTRTAVRKERAEPVARSVVRRDVTGTELGTVDLEPTVFGIEPNQAVLHQVVTAQLAAARAGTQSTKTRAEVRGGGAKPFRQKGTGRARQGSTRSPSWAGGGVALGPKPRSYRQRTAEEDGPLALLLGPLRPGRRRAGGRWSTPGVGTSRRPSRRRRPRGPRPDRPGARRPGRRRHASPSGPSPTCRPSRPTRRGELSAYDVLRNDWIVFTDETLPGADVVEVVEVIDASTRRP